ncbi:sodium ion-translocating decarboxylase subunit beta [Desulfoscipio gibsoniae]|uniref:Sodium ion-translocating decarboxylase, beta subunit n=1 Tax=Desulfoscipio gibsoniae DSM 7213 TaxID=767817 RepID=R4KKV1_9FIRM|nr:sodium ion-translocating decarboxylase subunit beta [Desulfoscipio gibsoniae]AGL03833.1 sodium ion-translocating decarboxylase, beta subunit [Desulfoscipio gibsoniae DSM 7213]
MEQLAEIFSGVGITQLTLGNVTMWLIAFVLFYLAIKKGVEPLLLLPIGFGVFAANFPLTGLLEEGGLFYIFYHFGIENELIPPLIFLGLGAMTDFGPVIANPKTLLLGAAAQLGVYGAFFGALLVGFTVAEAACIGIIGGADGPTSIFLSANLAPHMMGSVAVAAYSYMALVPIIIPPIAKLLTTKEERAMVMNMTRMPSKTEKIVFPILASIVIILLVPKSAPLIAMFMLGNLFMESGVVERLTNVSRDQLMNIVTIILGVGVGSTMTAETFLNPKTIGVFAMGVVAFAFATAAGVLLAKLMNLFVKNKVNPLIGAAGVSAVPMAARVVHNMGTEANPQNYLLMHAMGPNVAGVIGTAVAAGAFIAAIL